MLLGTGRTPTNVSLAFESFWSSWEGRFLEVEPLGVALALATFAFAACVAFVAFMAFGLTLALDILGDVFFRAFGPLAFGSALVAFALGWAVDAALFFGSALALDASLAFGSSLALAFDAVLAFGWVLALDTARAFGCVLGFGAALVFGWALAFGVSFFFGWALALGPAARCVVFAFARLDSAAAVGSYFKFSVLSALFLAFGTTCAGVLMASGAAAFCVASLVSWGGASSDTGGMGSSLLSTVTLASDEGSEGFDGSPWCKGQQLQRLIWKGIWMCGVSRQ